MQFGYCYSCCTSWTRLGNVGKLADGSSLTSIWNSDTLQMIRRAVLDNDLGKVCNFQTCPYAISKEYVDLESAKNGDPAFDAIIDQIIAGKTELETPPYSLTVSSSGRCNLDCVMCQADHGNSRKDDELDRKIFTEILPEILPGLARLYLLGNGEVFFNPHSRKFLQTLDADRYPSLTIDLLTNGTLFTRKLWETISHNRYGSIGVSIDAATAETYQHVRRNGNWDVLRRNLDLIAELRANNVFSQFSIYFCVMKSNYREMKQFVELGRAIGCDNIEFTKIFGDVIEENINLTSDKRIFAEIGAMLADPIFREKGVNALMIDDYRAYEGVEISAADRLVTSGKELGLYLPAKALKFLGKHQSFHRVMEILARLKKTIIE
jgi:wyosine [tRNA(Phe)-imidazoG37] synthetase (radical SAM superfamily)